MNPLPTRSLPLVILTIVLVAAERPGDEGRLRGQLSNPVPGLRLVTDVSGIADHPRSNRLEFRKFGGIEYRSDAEYRLTLDIYVPQGKGPWPAILAVHGGGWRSGTKLNWFRHARKLARAGFVVVAINYRHAPEFRFPAQIHDCKAAVRWMRRHSEQYRIDPDRIGGVGYSAGGHLVALLGTTDADDGLEGPVPEEELGISTRLQAVAAGGAVCEFSWIDRDSDALSYWLGGSRKDNPAIYRQAAPLTHISPDDPPFYFFHGADDWIVPDSSPRTMHDALIRQSLFSRFDLYENYGHFGLFSELDALTPVIEFFRQQLGRKPKS
jgi:acetyl esterase/lipase